MNVKAKEESTTIPVAKPASIPLGAILASAMKDFFPEEHIAKVLVYSCDFCAFSLLYCEEMHWYE